MAWCVASVRPRPPIIVTYIHEIGRIDADPNGAAAMAGTAGDPGRNGARCALTATGPTPGPPPPWGMQNVLWRLRCDTSAPNSPGFAVPTNALRFAPSRYTCPPYSWTTEQISPIRSSKTPCVDG